MEEEDLGDDSALGIRTQRKKIALEVIWRESSQFVKFSECVGVCHCEWKEGGEGE